MLPAVRRPFARLPSPECDNSLWTPDVQSCPCRSRSLGVSALSRRGCFDKACNAGALQPQVTRQLKLFASQQHSDSMRQ